MAPPSVIIDTVFIPLYALLYIAAVALMFRHGMKGGSGGLHLIKFSLYRFIGNILLVYAYFDNSRNQGVYIAGYLLQSLGYTFLLVAALVLLQRATGKGDKVRGLHWSERIIHDPARILQILSIVALILLIFGFIDSSTFDDPSALVNESDANSPGGYDVKVKIAYVLLLTATVGFAALTLKEIIRPTISQENRRAGEPPIARLLMIAVPFMLSSMIYSTVAAFRAKPLDVSVWIKLVFFQLAQAATALTFTLIGFAMPKKAAADALAQYAGDDIEAAEMTSKPATPFDSETPPALKKMLQV